MASSTVWSKVDKVLQEVLPQDKTAAECFTGPTETSNWIIPGVILAGAYPGSTIGQQQHRKKIETLIQEGITTFVCLQQRYELEHRFVPYMPIAAEVAKREGRDELWKHTPYELIPDDEYNAARMYGKSLPGITPKYRHFSTADGGGPFSLTEHGVTQLSFPITDTQIAEDDALLKFIKHLATRVVTARKLRTEGETHEVFYVHCWGGHGRTGTIVSLLLIALFRLDSMAALRYVNYAQSFRKWTKGNVQQCQQDQIERLCSKACALSLRDYTSHTSRNTDTD